jgi:hypothetical protein
MPDSLEFSYLHHGLIGNGALVSDARKLADAERAVFVNDRAFRANAAKRRASSAQIAFFGVRSKKSSIVASEEVIAHPPWAPATLKFSGCYLHSSPE